MLKCTKFDFRWDYAPDPAGGAYSAPQALAVFKGDYVLGESGGKGRERWRGEGVGKGEEKGRGGGK